MGLLKKPNLETYHAVLIVAIIPIVLGGMRLRPFISEKDPNLDESCTPIDYNTIDVNDTSQLVELMGQASKCADMNLGQFIRKEISKTQNINLILLTGEMVYSTVAPGFMDLKISLLQTAYNLTVSLTGVENPTKEDDLNAYRLVTYWLGLGLEESGDTLSAKNLHEKAVEQGLWNVPEQRPMPFFPFISGSGPFPKVSDYSEVVRILEDNYKIIKEELIMRKDFPGQLYAQSDTIMDDGKWITLGV